MKNVLLFSLFLGLTMQAAQALKPQEQRLLKEAEGPHKTSVTEEKINDVADQFASLVFSRIMSSGHHRYLYLKSARDLDREFVKKVKGWHGLQNSEDVGEHTFLMKKNLELLKTPEVETMLRADIELMMQKYDVLNQYIDTMSKTLNPSHVQPFKKLHLKKRIEDRVLTMIQEKIQHLQRYVLHPR